MSSTTAVIRAHEKSLQEHSVLSEKDLEGDNHAVGVGNDIGNLVYDEDEEEPEIHARTYFALAAMFFLNYVQVFALQGPPAILSVIEADLNNTAAGTWVPNALNVVQAVVAPVLASASDTFQLRKWLLVGPCVISFIGAAIAPGSSNIYRLIVAQILIGFGFATVPLAYCVPSEILPRKWRPMAQSAMNFAAALAALTGPLIAGGLTEANAQSGWRNFYWIQMALWGTSAIGLFIGYRPPKRHTRYDHLSFTQKIARLDLIGVGLLTTGLTLLLAGLNLGGGIFAWTAAPVLATLIIGIVILIAFGVYEWKFTKIGIFHHDLFRGGRDYGRTFAICVALIFIEGCMLFAYIIFYPVLTTSLFTTDTFIVVAREEPFWGGAAVSTMIFGYCATKFRTIRSPLFIGFAIYTIGLIGLATIQPNDSNNELIFVAIAGIGFGCPLAIIIAGVQLSTPHDVIATATALTTSSRAVSASIFTAIFGAAVTTRLDQNIPNYVAAAALGAGLPKTSLMAFVEAIAKNDAAALPKIPGVTPAIIGASVVAMKQALADGLRIVWIIAAPFGALACILCYFLGDMKTAMTYHVDAPVEELRARHHGRSGGDN